jgi:uncharacterized damage-inducible protein DinB
MLRASRKEVFMRNTIATLALCALLAPAASAEELPAGIRGEIIANMMDAGEKVQELATAVPDGKYNWKPSKDVRSMGQVFLHIVTANYFLPTMMGGPQPPMPMEELQKLDTQTMDPPRIRQMLKESYAWAAKVIADTPDDQLGAEMSFFGQKMSRRAGMMILASHSHEHLGQAIAYARSINVTPPWTAREQAAQKKKAEDKKAGY